MALEVLKQKFIFLVLKFKHFPIHKVLRLKGVNIVRNGHDHQSAINLHLCFIRLKKDSKEKKYLFKCLTKLWSDVSKLYVFYAIIANYIETSFCNKYVTYF